MKGRIAGLVAGIILGSAATAGASAQWFHSGMGVACQTGASGFKGVTCIRLDGQGYGVAINRQLVMVYDLDNSKRVYWKAQR